VLDVERRRPRVPLLERPLSFIEDLLRVRPDARVERLPR